MFQFRNEMLIMRLFKCFFQMRLESMSFPYFSHGCLAYANCLGHRSRAPMGTVLRLLFNGFLHNLLDFFRPIDACPAGPRIIIETCYFFFNKSPSPLSNGIAAGSKRFGNFLILKAINSFNEGRFCSIHPILPDNLILVAFLMLSPYIKRTTCDIANQGFL